MSLTPNARLICVRSSIGRASRPSCRRGEMGGLSCGVRRAGRAASRSAAAARRAREASSSAWRGERAARAGMAARSSWLRARSVSPRPSSLEPLGGDSGAQASGAGSGAAGSGSSSRLPSSTAAIPSTMQWWALPTTPIRPSSSRSAIQTCHRGRWRGSGFDMHSSITSPSRSDLRGDHVPGDVEVHVVHPNRGVDPERHRLQRLPVPRGPRQPACDVLAKLLEAGPDPVARAARRPPPSPRACGRSASPPPGTRRQAAIGA